MGSYNWLIFALGAVACWGLYGIFLHSGQVGMADQVNGRYKAFLFVGVAYFFTAVLAPLAILVVRSSDWNFPQKGLWLSLIAGTLGAIENRLRFLDIKLVTAGLNNYLVCHLNCYM